MKTQVLESLEMARQLKDKLNSLNKTRFTALAITNVEQVVHWLKDEAETE